MNDLADDGTDMMFIYEWVDSVPLSRPKKNISRDFSDGVLLAEMIKNHTPSLVELHNYPSTNSTTQKIFNWNLLNTKVLKKIGLQLSKNEIDGVIKCQPGVIENILKKTHEKLVIHSGKKESIKDEEYLEDNFKIEKKNKTKDFQEIDYKNILFEKDRTIMELKSTLEILEMKLYNSEDENRRLIERIESLKDILRKSGKL